MILKPNPIHKQKMSQVKYCTETLSNNFLQERETHSEGCECLSIQINLYYNGFNHLVKVFEIVQLASPQILVP